MPKWEMGHGRRVSSTETGARDGIGSMKKCFIDRTRSQIGIWVDEEGFHGKKLCRKGI
ncbi:hypothetical protein [Neobacillus sp. FSL H8-0543]|uniref:hypothetical protein n=1 Tax=Neobacillus sp. FSL H8-0543 TaxID=2954672 RepID=UPI003158EF3F